MVGAEAVGRILPAKELRRSDPQGQGRCDSDEIGVILTTDTL